ncbi:hypothetical protein [Actinomadura rugatobispora]|uniref:Secreted protein n=1 Tax=Actinomadura rugatobispora TaxID=1994 RepID=A0ABW0ZU27_9ACTN|nr:hypothetical protein GCM10010200_001380 [Actinomadura rugatobispora]
MAAVFAASFWTGGSVGPVAGTGDGGGAEGGAGPVPSAPSGLQISEDGYTLVRTMSEIPPGERTEFGFMLLGPGGLPVTGFTPVDGARLHLLVMRRDLAGYQHLYPAEAGGGQWSVTLTLAEAGIYRFLVYAQPEGAARPVLLGAEVVARGTLRPRPLPRPEPVARVAGYEVGLTGAPVAGRVRTLTFSVSERGRPVTGLQGRRGGLAVVRAGDLALLRTPRDAVLGAHRVGAGPDLRFPVAPPSPGAYRLFLEFRHRGVSHTAEFTVLAEQPAAISPDGPLPGERDPHGHG